MVLVQVFVDALIEIVIPVPGNIVDELEDTKALVRDRIRIGTQMQHLDLRLEDLFEADDGFQGTHKSNRGVLDCEYDFIDSVKFEAGRDEQYRNIGRLHHGPGSGPEECVAVFIFSLAAHNHEICFVQFNQALDAVEDFALDNLVLDLEVRIFGLDLADPFLDPFVRVLIDLAFLGGIPNGLFEEAITKNDGDAHLSGSGKVGGVIEGFLRIFREIDWYDDVAHNKRAATKLRIRSSNVTYPCTRRDYDRFFEHHDAIHDGIGIRLHVL